MYIVWAQRYCKFQNFGSKLTPSKNLYFFRHFFQENRKRWPKLDHRFAINVKNLLKKHMVMSNDHTVFEYRYVFLSKFSCWLQISSQILAIFYASCGKRVLKNTNFFVRSTLTQNLQTHCTAVPKFPISFIEWNPVSIVSEKNSS